MIICCSVGGMRMGHTASQTPPAGNDNYLQGSLTVSRFVDTRKQGKLGNEHFITHVLTDYISS